MRLETKLEEEKTEPAAAQIADGTKPATEEPVAAEQVAPPPQPPPTPPDPRALELEGPGGVLHAKALVVDDEAVFVTSANLTEAALDRNIEVGLLVRDRALALTVSSHFRGLIDRGLLRPLPIA
jgi:phosphatidylserine/phosphatidylglycerophosphate/cardiolipin synthase-like enzyme